METAVFGGGCFWCLETVFVRLKGVSRVVSGYCGGAQASPSYEAVCSGNTGHAEVIEITYDPAQVTYEQLLTVFFALHDPTTLNRQGHDVGTQYRSVIFGQTEAQREAARRMIAQLNRDGVFGSPVVTEVAPASPFYPAEDYHQGYYEGHQTQPYCAYVISPKVQKLRDKFSEWLK